MAQHDEPLEASWVLPAHLRRYPLRSPIVTELIEYVENGGAIHPLNLIVWGCNTSY